MLSERQEFINYNAMVLTLKMITKRTNLEVDFKNNIMSEFEETGEFIGLQGKGWKWISNKTAEENCSGRVEKAFSSQYS